MMGEGLFLFSALRNWVLSVALFFLISIQMASRNCSSQPNGGQFASSSSRTESTSIGRTTWDWMITPDGGTGLPLATSTATAVLKLSPQTGALIARIAPAPNILARFITAILTRTAVSILSKRVLILHWARRFPKEIFWSLARRFPRCSREFLIMPPMAE